MTDCLSEKFKKEERRQIRETRHLAWERKTHKCKCNSLCVFEKRLNVVTTGDLRGVQPFTGNVVYKSWLPNLQLEKDKKKKLFLLPDPM